MPTDQAQFEGQSDTVGAEAKCRTAEAAAAANTQQPEADKNKKTRNYAYFSHRECEYFPCHPGADPNNFNCLFCYCPFYLLGTKCGGNFRITEKGIKDCTDCLYPHRRENYDEIIRRYREIAAAMPDMKKQNDK